jgi:hypothetical protein
VTPDGIERAAQRMLTRIEGYTALPRPQDVDDLRVILDANKQATEHLEAIRDEAIHDDPSAHVVAALACLQGDADA